MTKPRTRLILGSASPRRAKILSDLGVPFDVVVPEVRELWRQSRPRWTARENAVRKNAWCRTRFPGRRILTADTLVVLDGRCVGKPATRREAAAFLRAFSGRPQSVLTGVAFYAPGRGLTVDVVESIVRFRVLTRAGIAAYLARVNPLDKAGGYDIDQCGEMIVASCSGSRTNVMGLPAERVRELLA